MTRYTCTTGVGVILVPLPNGASVAQGQVFVQQTRQLRPKSGSPQKDRSISEPRKKKTPGKEPVWSSLGGFSMNLLNISWEAIWNAWSVILFRWFFTQFSVLNQRLLAFSHTKIGEDVAVSNGRQALLKCELKVPTGNNVLQLSSIWLYLSKAIL